MPLMPTGQLTSALTAETSGSMGIIIGAIAGVIIGLALALVFVRRHCHPNDKRHKNVTPQAPKGSQAQFEPDEKGAAASTVTAEWDEMATFEPKLAVVSEVEHFKLEHASEPWSAGSPSKQATISVVIAEAAADGHAGGPAGHAGRPAQPAPPEWI
jgi:hypothetical protein